MPRILLLEDEDGLRASLARGLSHEAGWTVVDGPDLDTGLQLLDAQVPDVIISDIDMPGRIGLEILGELGKRGLKIPVIFLTAYMKAFSAQVPKHRQVDMREKPISLDDLRSLVREKLAPAADTTAPAPFSAADYLQLACMGSHSVTISLHRREVLCGEINVVRGEIWSAKEDKTLGKEAFTRLVFDQSLHAECRTLVGEPPPRNLQGRWEAMLLDAARERDEAVERGELPSVAQAPATTPDEGAFATLWERALDAMLSRNHEEALKAFLAANKIRPGDPKVLANIRRLEDMGVREENPS